MAAVSPLAATPAGADPTGAPDAVFAPVGPLKRAASLMSRFLPELLRTTPAGFAALYILAYIVEAETAQRRAVARA